MKKQGRHGNAKRRLTAAILAWLSALPVTASAYTTEYVYHNGSPFVELNVLGKGEGLGKEDDYAVKPAEYELSRTLIDATKSSTSYWSAMLGDGAKNSQPWQVFITTRENYKNASAATASSHKEDGKSGEAVADNYVAKLIQDGKTLNVMNQEVATSANPPAGDYGFSEILIGQHFGANRAGAIDGWWVDTDTVLPTNEQATDFVGTFRHELGHALGIAMTKQYFGENGNIVTSENEQAYNSFNEELLRLSADLSDPDSWNMHLVDQNGNHAKPGMKIVTTDYFNELKAADPTLKESDFFIVDNANRRKDLTGAQGYAYFVGAHVTEALAGATFNGVSGLPVNAWEGDGKYTFEGSHLQTTGMMSHRPYSNYTSFMEAEIAVMQDLGYHIDRKAYFGYSVYGDGGTITNTNGYFARNADGTAYLENTYSAVPLGIGLHIYGSKNTVTQAANILTRGTGATGVRVDGVENRLVIPSGTEIHADGYRGNGILIAYGRDHVVEQSGTVTATGQGGTGIRFDFGSSSNGAQDEYRGSYIRYGKRFVNDQTGEITMSGNDQLTDMDKFTYNSTADELDGALVERYDLSGTLAGGENAIYISKNAFVKNINVNEGASIRGNITSDWKHFATDGSYDASTDPILKDTTKALRIQYNGKTGNDGYAYDAYIPDLVTNLNFNADIDYSGNITGADNMKLSVLGGTLTYGGTANVVNVNVAKGASLFGGNYTVNDMTASMADGFSDDTTGKFYNHGTVGASSADANMAINGAFVSDGVLCAYGGGSAGAIAVSGTANIDGSTVSVTNALPDETWTALTAATLSGAVTNPAGTPYAATGMLNTTGAVDGSSVTVTTAAANNLGAMDRVQSETYGAMMHMYDGLTAAGDTRRNEMRTLFSLDAADAKEAFSSLSSNSSAQSMGLVQASPMAGRIVSSRLAEALALKPASVKIPAASLGGDEEKSVEMPMKLDQPADNEFWFKAAKNWGDLKGGAYYHGTTLAIGWDRALGKIWRGGFFVSHGTSGFANTGASNELRDTRLGFYGGCSTGPHMGHVYLDFGWLKNDLRRSIAHLGLSPEADYNSRILELGGEYSYDLNAKKMTPWHFSPYANVQLSRLWQGSYTERGAGIFGQRVSDAANNYFAGGVGIEAKRYLANGSYALRVGVKHAFTGTDPRLTFGYVGDDAASYEMKYEQDKTHFVMSLGGEAEFAPGWWLAGDAALQKGAHDKDVMCALTLRRMW